MQNLHIWASDDKGLSMSERKVVVPCIIGVTIMPVVCVKCGQTEVRLYPGLRSAVRGRCKDCRHRGLYGFLVAPLYVFARFAGYLTMVGRLVKLSNRSLR